MYAGRAGGRTLDVTRLNWQQRQFACVKVRCCTIGSRIAIPLNFPFLDRVFLPTLYFPKTDGRRFGVFQTDESIRGTNSKRWRPIGITVGPTMLDMTSFRQECSQPVLWLNFEPLLFTAITYECTHGKHTELRYNNRCSRLMHGKIKCVGKCGLTNGRPQTGSVGSP